MLRTMLKAELLVALDDRIDGQQPSDHYPVMAVLELPQ